MRPKFTRTTFDRLFKDDVFHFPNRKTLYYVTKSAQKHTYYSTVSTPSKSYKRLADDKIVLRMLN